MATDPAAFPLQETHPAASSGLGPKPTSLLTLLAFAALVMVPLLEIIGRRTTGFGIAGAASWVQHMTLWLAFLGGILATAQSRHLRIATLELINAKSKTIYLERAGDAITIGVLTGFGLASLTLVRFEYASPDKLGGLLPLWLAMAAMPAGFLFMAVRTILTSSQKLPVRMWLALAGVIAALGILYLPENTWHVLPWVGIPLLIVMGMLGLPIFALLGGTALLLFLGADIPIAAIPSETYRIITQPVFPSIPLFAVTGTVLAAGGAPKRLTQLVTAWTGWLPGGAAISTVIGCALFTAITGASGVTILALGGLLLPVLLGAGLTGRFSTGLLTSSGSVGLLFPPSLPVILYGIYGHVAIDELFLAGLIPGILLIVMIAGFSVFSGRHADTERPGFDLRHAMDATWNAKWDLMLPVIVLFGLFGGIMTLVETAALSALWAVLLETVLHRKLSIRRGLVPTVLESGAMLGALLIVIGMASGLILYFVDAQVPMHMTEWVTQTVSSKWAFLLILNALLLLAGAFMDIFSAIVIVVPLTGPMAQAFGIDPLHLGVIFLANLELGYLTPPVGMNLFLASLRFERPLLEIWRTVVPFLAIFALWVLLIVYVPALSLGLGRMLG